MAFSNTHDTTNPGSAVSNREDLADYVSILAPEKTPVLSMSPKASASATNHEWTVDTLEAPQTAGVVEGSDVTQFSDKFANRARLGNRVQRLRRDYRVSKEQQAVESVGPAKIAQAEQKAILELKRDVEATLISNNDKTVEDGAGTPNAMRGLGDWVDSAGPADVPAAYRTPAGSIHSSGLLTETIFGNIITSIFRTNGMANGLTLVADTALRRVVSGFHQTGSANDVRSVNYNGMEAKLALAVEFYRSDHGTVDIIDMNPATSPNTTDKDVGYFINWDYIQVAELLPMGSERLPDLGGGPRGFVDWFGTLVVKHPGAFGKITDVTT